jgi:hypothetical protein
VSTTTAPPEVIDADAVDDTDPHPDAPTTVHSTELAVMGSAGAIIRADDPREILGKAKQIAVALKELIEQAGLSVALDRRNPDRKHVEVGGWQAAGTLLGALGGQPLHSETVWTRRVAGEDGRPQRTQYTATVKRYHSKANGGGIREEITYDVDGFDWEARVDIKTPSGTVVGTAEAMVSRAENTWSQRDDYALRSMAETRAESRAYRKAIGWIVHIAGYNPTPAEEMGHTPGADTSAPVSGGPPFGPPIAEDQKGRLRDALRFLVALDDDPGDADASVTGVPSVDDLVKAVADNVTSLVAQYNDGNAYMPQIVATALLQVAGTRQKRAQARRDPKGPDAPKAQEPSKASREATEAAPAAVDPEQAARIVAAEAAIAQILNIGDGHDELRREADRRMRAINCGPEQIQRMLQEAGGSDGLHKLLGRIPAPATDSATTRKAA